MEYLFSACGWCGGIVNLLDSGASFLCVHTRQSYDEPNQPPLGKYKTSFPFLIFDFLLHNEGKEESY
jgi:hypothetical protein